MRVLVCFLLLVLTACHSESVRSPYGYIRQFSHYKTMDECPEGMMRDKLVWCYWQLEIHKVKLGSFTKDDFSNDPPERIYEIDHLWYQLQEMQIRVLDALSKPRENNNVEIDRLLAEFKGLAQLYLTFQGL